MAEHPIFLAGNLYDDLLYTSHTVTANEEATGNEAYHVANGRRSVDDYWTPTTANNDAWLKVDCGSAKTADMIAIDRGHTLAGQSVTVAHSSDDVTYTDLFTSTIPSASGSSTDIDTTNGAYTEEGAWVKRFTSTSARYWRVTVAAAASYTPIIVGLSLGEAWAPGAYPDRPFDEDGSSGVWEAAGNDLGWSAASSAASPRSGEMSIRIASFDDADARSFLAIYRTGKPVWFVPDPSKAERAFVVKVPSGARVEAPLGAGDWGYRTVRLPYVEHEPALG